MRVIMVDYAERPEGHAAYEQAVDWARARDAVLHVVRLMREPAASTEAQVDAWQESVSEVRSWGQGLVASLGEQGLSASFELVTEPGEQRSERLLEVAERVEAELLVIGLRRRSPVGKLVMGSTAQDVLLRAPCPVLAVKVPA